MLINDLFPFFQPEIPGERCVVEQVAGFDPVYTDVLSLLG